MATTSRIAAIFDDKILSIYCHWDGFLDNVGAELKAHFNIDEKVKSLISGGDASFIEKGVVEYYTSRGEPLKIMTSVDGPSLISSNDEDFLYLWKEGNWLIYNDFVEGFTSFEEFSESLEDEDDD